MTLVATEFFKVSVNGVGKEYPPETPYYGVPVEMLDSEYWKLKTSIAFGWYFDEPLYWCLDTDSAAIKKSVVTNNVAFLTAFSEFVNERIAYYKANPAILKLDSIRNTPSVYEFYTGDVNGDQSNLVNRRKISVDVSEFVYNAAKAFYDQHGRLPLVLFDDYAGQPLLMRNDPMLQPDGYAFERDANGVKCPMWMFLGAVQVPNVVKLTDTGPRFVSDAAYFQYKFNLWCQVAGVTSLYVAPHSHEPIYGWDGQYQHMMYGHEITLQLKRDGVVSFNITADWIGSGFARIYNPAYEWYLIGYGGGGSGAFASLPSRNNIFWQQYETSINNLAVLTTERARVLSYFPSFDFSPYMNTNFKDRPKGYFDVYKQLKVRRRYLTTPIPIMCSVVDAVARTYETRLPALAVEFQNRRDQMDKASWMGLVTFALTAVGMYFAVANIANLFAGNFTFANVSSAIKMADQFELIDSSSFMPVLTLTNTVYNLGAGAIDRLSGMSQNVIDSTADFSENATMWDEFDFDGSGGNWGGDSWTVSDGDWWDTGWLTDPFVDTWNDFWGGSVETMADVTPGLTATQIAITSGASPADAAEIASIAQQASNSTDYWGTFQNLLEGAAGAVKTIGGLVIQYKQAEMAFERLKGPTPAPQYATRPTTVGQPVRQPDGSISTLNPDGSITTVRPNGQVLNTGGNAPLPNFSTIFTPKNLMIGGGVVAVLGLGYLAMRNSGGRSRRR